MDLPSSTDILVKHLSQTPAKITLFDQSVSNSQEPTVQQIANSTTDHHAGPQLMLFARSSVVEPLESMALQVIKHNEGKRAFS